MRAIYNPALVATLLLAAPLWAGMQQLGHPSGAGAHPGYSGQRYSAQPQPTQRYSAQPQPARSYGAYPPQAPYAQPHQFYRGQGPHNGDWLRNTMRLSPQEQQRRLEQDPHFRQLPPQRQEQLRNRLQFFNSMPAQEQQRVLNRMEMIEHLPPAQQQEARALFGQFRAMDPQRKDMMRSTLRQMRTMPPEARERLLNSPETRSRYSPQEVQMLRAFNAIGFVGPE